MGREATRKHTTLDQYWDRIGVHFYRKIWRENLMLSSPQELQAYKYVHVVKFRFIQMIIPEAGVLAAGVIFFVQATCLTLVGHMTIWMLK